jgi:glucose/mannose transport system permease protein
MTNATVGRADGAATRPPPKALRNLSSKIAALPMMFVAIVVFIGCTLWSFLYSFTDAVVLPAPVTLFPPDFSQYAKHFVGFTQYVRLFAQDKWNVSVHNLFAFGVFTLIGEFVIGYLLAVFIDQKIRFEDGFRTIFLYPFALSGIVTGLAWEWMLNPVFGLEKTMHDLGWTSFSFDWIANREMVIYSIVIAAVWQGSGLVMALMLAGLRGIDEDIWKAARVDGIPTWRTYVFIVTPMLRPVFITSLVLVAANIVRTFDIVVAMTGGGPGYQSYLPANYVYEKLPNNLGQSLAASASMMLIVVVIVAPWAFYEFGRKRQ